MSTRKVQSQIFRNLFLILFFVFLGILPFGQPAYAGSPLLLPPAGTAMLTLEAWEDAADDPSCPWVFPWNGTEFVKDNDIYSVARYPEGEYTDYYLLEQPLVLRSGTYDLEIREIENEDSWTDYVGLLAVDHDTGVAVGPDANGNIFAYRPDELIAPVSALSSGGSDVQSMISAKDNNGFAAYSEEYIEVDFGDVDVSQGARIVVRVKGFIAGSGEDRPFIGPPAVVIQAFDGFAWQEVGRLKPRFAWSEAVFDLSPYLPDTEGDNKIRVSSISHGIKYHEVDLVALSAGSEPAKEINGLALVSADFNGGDVISTLNTADNEYVMMTTGDKFSLSFASGPQTLDEREFIFVSEGYYIPKGNTYYVYTWDGNSWVERANAPFATSDETKTFDLSAFLPDFDDEYKVRVYQSYGSGAAGIDFVGLDVDGAGRTLLSATDVRDGSDIMSLIESSDDVRIEYPKEMFGSANRYTQYAWEVVCTGTDTDGDGQCDDSDADDDNDGVPDTEDSDPLNPAVCEDADSDGCDDCSFPVDGFGPQPDNDTLNDGIDIDGDGYCSVNDCNDLLQNVFPGAPELCDTLDNDCDPTTVDGLDESWYAMDCDGADIDLCEEGSFICLFGFQFCTDNTNTNAEVCDGIDNDCDGIFPPDETDDDGDGQFECQGDCDDSDVNNWLGNAEVCDGQDNDCNGLDDVLGFDNSETDNDGDGLSECELDCDDADSNNYPGNTEVCDDQDNDCDKGTADGSGETWFGTDCDGPDSDLCDEGTNQCVNGEQTCTDTTNDNVEVCDTVDNDCDEETPDGSDEEWYGVDCDGPDADLCDEGVLDCVAGEQACTDDTGDNEEICDLEDNDCDGETDEDPVTLTTSVSPAEAGYVEPDCSGEGCQYACFTEVDLIAVAGAGNAFDSWSVCDDASDRFCTITMDDHIDTTANFMECEAGFQDVAPGFWAEDAILLAACNNVVYGCDAELGLYCPPQVVTRAELAAYVIRALYGEDFSYSGIPHFLDVADTYWGFRYIQRMYEDGIVSGCGAGNYCSTGLITRAEATVSIVRALYGDSFTYSPEPYFTDVPDTHWAFRYIQRLVDDGVISGYGDGTFRPSWKITRAQMATMISKAFLGM